MKRKRMPKNRAKLVFVEETTFGTAPSMPNVSARIVEPEHVCARSVGVSVGALRKMIEGLPDNATLTIELGPTPTVESPK